ncbi:ComEC/Rec2-related protein [Rubritalea squalenifaciens DSM 18772]|uniref:ComEC/Rec2-related protein n=1 Tax=Rubritalea squalenifaciens DSM 18772 TaxID=1123071 RepID=A0A1M6D5U8_9BACT|nr:ComEC/Rec2 family competence protein [Rubritalea squalenifaciens]SHI68625.1 ComEC/Rec2-related protein [Rubritalea squalenifaciens DSM 18772]
MAARSQLPAACLSWTESRLGKWIRRQVMVLPALASVAAVLLVDQWSWLLCFALLAFLLLSCLGGLRCLLLALFCSVASGVLYHERLAREYSIAAHLGERVEAPFTVMDEVRSGREGWEVMVTPTVGPSTQDRLYLDLPWMEVKPLVGDVLLVKGRLVAPAKAMNPAAWDQQDWLARRGVHTVLDAWDAKPTGEVDKRFLLQRWAWYARGWIGERITAGLEPGGQDEKVIRAMFLGERPQGAREMVEDFRKSGTIHVFAVSGLHVMMIGGFVAFMLRLLGVPRKVWVLAVIAVMFFYAMVTGMRPPAMRAAVMGSLVIGAWLFSRKPVLGNGVALSALVAVLWNGHMIFMPGFQLSFGVLVAIVLTTSLVHRCFRWIHYMDPFLPRPLYSRYQECSLWTRRQLSGGLTVGGSAWLGSAPLMFWHFGIVTPASFLLGVPLVFMAFFIMSLCCVSLCIGSLWPQASQQLNRLNGLQAAGARGMAAALADAPGSHFLHKEWQQGERVVVYAMPEGGACAYLGIGGGALLDAGDRDAFYQEVWPSLNRYGAPVDSMIATHADSQHCGGFLPLLERYQIQQALVPDEGQSRGLLRSLLSELDSQGVTTLRAGEGQRLALDADSWIEVLYAPGNVGGLADDRCLVLRLHWRGKTLLFLGDSGFEFEQWAMQGSVDLSADILVLGKHREDLSGSPALLEKISPKLVIASEHAFPEGESRGEAWYASLEQQGIQVHRLDQSGAAILEPASDGIKLRAFRYPK